MTTKLSRTLIECAQHCITSSLLPLHRNGMQETLCSALDSLIEECTVILGWCYTSAEVEDTKRRQRALMAEAMEAAHFDSALCLGGGGETKISEPLTAASAASPAASRAANIAAAVVATGVLMIFPR